MVLDKATKTTILIKGALRGSQKAFSDLMDLYWEDVVKFLNHKKVEDYIREDVAVIAFTKAFEKLESYNPQFSFNTWLLTIVNNTLIDSFRKRKDSTVSIDEIFVDGSGNEFKIDFKSSSLSPEEELIEIQEDDFVITMINSLRDDYSKVLKMRYVNNLSYKEISDKLDIPMNLVKVRIMRGRKMLVDLISKSKELEG